MRRFAFLASLSFVLTLAVAPAVNAQTVEERPVRVGAGASVNLGSLTFIDGGSVGILPLGLAGLQVPIRISGILMLEPEVGFFTTSRDRDDDLSESTTTFRLALGALYLIDLAEATNAYVGLRAGVFLSSEEDEFTDTGATQLQESSQTSPFVSLALGGEYYFSPSFSIGGEVDFTFLSIGDQEVTVDGQPVAGGADASTSFSTSTTLIIRWFFL